MSVCFHSKSFVSTHWLGSAQSDTEVISPLPVKTVSCAFLQYGSYLLLNLGAVGFREVNIVLILEARMSRNPSPQHLPLGLTVGWSFSPRGWNEHLPMGALQAQLPLGE